MRYNYIEFPEIEEDDITTELVQDFIKDAEIIFCASLIYSKDEITSVDVCHRGPRLIIRGGPDYTWAYNLSGKLVAKES